MRPVIITAGGTGGHVFPALAVADYLNERGIPLLWLGSSHGLETRVVPASGYDLITIEIGGLRGKGLWRRIVVVSQLLIALPRILLLLKRVRPVAVLGMGGFVSGPAGVAAWLMRIPLLIHEQNTIPGLTNRLLAPFATRVMEAFPGTFARREKVLHTGNPVRPDIVEIEAPGQRVSAREEPLRVLVMGGSQGAARLNRVLPEVIGGFEADALEVWHQTGERDELTTSASYRTLGVPARVDSFIDKMGAAYAWADVVICRSGALTVCELAAAGVAAILIPFPQAVDDHQTANARYLSDKDAAVLVPETRANKDYLSQLISQFSATREGLVEMAKRARELSVPDATRRVAELCMETAGV